MSLPTALADAITQHDGGHSYQTDPYVRATVTVLAGLMHTYDDELRRADVPTDVRADVARRAARAVFPPRTEHLARLAVLHEASRWTTRRAPHEPAP